MTKTPTQSSTKRKENERIIQVDPYGNESWGTTGDVTIKVNSTSTSKCNCECHSGGDQKKHLGYDIGIGDRDCPCKLFSSTSKTWEKDFEELLVDRLVEDYPDNIPDLIAFIEALIASERRKVLEELIDVFKDRDPLDTYTTNVIMLELKVRLDSLK